MTNWNAIRGNRQTDELKFMDYRALEQVDRNRVYRASGGHDMVDINRASGPFHEPMSTAKLRRLGLVEPVQPGDRYRLTEAGVKELNAWRDSRAQPTQQPEGTPA